MLIVNKGDVAVDGDSTVVLTELAVLIKAFYNVGFTDEDIDFVLDLVRSDNK